MQQMVLARIVRVRVLKDQSHRRSRPPGLLRRLQVRARGKEPDHIRLSDLEPLFVCQADATMALLCSDNWLYLFLRLNIAFMQRARQFSAIYQDAE
jgi:hypothetical protein